MRAGGPTIADATYTDRILDHYPVEQLDDLAAAVVNKLDALPVTWRLRDERVRLERVLAAVERRIDLRSQAAAPTA